MCIMVGDVMAITNIIQNRVKEYALVLPSEDPKGLFGSPTQTQNYKF